jgi:hypothetical protein
VWVHAVLSKSRHQVDGMAIVGGCSTVCGHNHYISDFLETNKQYVNIACSVMRVFHGYLQLSFKIGKGVHCQIANRIHPRMKLSSQSNRKCNECHGNEKLTKGRKRLEGNVHMIEVSTGVMTKTNLCVP